MSLSVATILAESARRHPDKVAAVQGPQHVTYVELWQQALHYAAVLRDRGIGRGDRVALLIPNVLDFPRCYYAALALGAVVVPVHALLTPDEVAATLRDAEASLLVATGPLVESGAKGAELAGVPLLTTITPEDSPYERLEGLAADVEPLTTYEPCEASDDAVILYTSGTTGRSKGAVLSHLNLTLNAHLSATEVVQLVRDDVILGCLPLFHSSRR